MLNVRSWSAGERLDATVLGLGESGPARSSSRDAHHEAGAATAQLVIMTRRNAPTLIELSFRNHAAPTPVP